MTVKFNRNNTNFQIAHFVAGNHHTADAAYFALRNLESERQRAVDSIPIADIKWRAKRSKLEEKSRSALEYERLEAQAELQELELEIKYFEPLAQSARAELAFIQECIERLQPLRKYGHMPDIEAAEACQAEEWGLELQRRAENYLLTSGTIPHDHFNTMRLHPAFETQLLPHIEQIHKTLQLPDGATQVLKLTKTNQEIPKLLGIDQ
jgi:hypothetical protein